MSDEHSKYKKYNDYEKEKDSGVWGRIKKIVLKEKPVPKNSVITKKIKNDLAFLKHYGSVCRKNKELDVDKIENISKEIPSIADSRSLKSYLQHPYFIHDRVRIKQLDLLKEVIDCIPLEMNKVEIHLEGEGGIIEFGKRFGKWIYIWKR